MKNKKKIILYFILYKFILYYNFVLHWYVEYSEFYAYANILKFRYRSSLNQINFGFVNFIFSLSQSELICDKNTRNKNTCKNKHFLLSIILINQTYIFFKKLFLNSIYIYKNVKYIWMGDFRHQNNEKKFTNMFDS